MQHITFFFLNKIELNKSQTDIDCSLLSLEEYKIFFDWSLLENSASICRMSACGWNHFLSFNCSALAVSKGPFTVMAVLTGFC